MNKPDFEPLGSRYLVLPDPIDGESETIGDVTLSTPKDPHKQADEGTIIARGLSCTHAEVGAKVFYGRFSGYDRQIDGLDYKIFSENELLGRRIAPTLEATDKLSEDIPPVEVKASEPGTCFICHGPASSPTSTLCNDCLPF